MAISQSILTTVIGLLALLAAGYLCGKIGFIDEYAGKKLTSILLYIAVPANIFCAYQREYNAEGMKNLLWAFAFSAMVFALIIPIGHLLWSKKGTVDREVCLLSSINPNAGFIGIPLITGIYGSVGVFYLTAMVTMHNVVSWTYGVILMGGKVSVKDTLKRLSSPAIITVILSLLCYRFGLLLPTGLLSPISKLADLNTPLAMLITGATLSRAGILSGLKDWRVYKAVSLRLLLFPALAALLLTRFPVDPMVIMVIALASGFPVASNVTLFAIRYGKNSALSSEALALSAVLCLLTLPLLSLWISFLLGR